MDEPPVAQTPAPPVPPDPGESSTPTKVLVGVVALLAAALGVLIVLLLTQKSSGTTGVAPTATAGATASATVEATETPTAEPTPTAAPTAPPTAAPTPVPGTPVTAAGAFLQTVPPPYVQSTSPPGTECHGLGDGGVWTVTQCSSFNRYGASGIDNVVVLAESSPGPGATAAWRVLIMHFSYGSGKWLVDLRYADDASAQSSNVSYVAHDLNGDGVSEIVVGFRLQGSGSILAYDLVDKLFDGPHVVAHRELSHGQASVGTNKITDWDATYVGGAPDCCPSYFQQDTVSWIANGWRVVKGPHVAAGGSGDF